MTTTANDVVPADEELLALIEERRQQVEIGAGEDELAAALRAVLTAIEYPPDMGPGGVLHSVAVLDALAAQATGREARLPGTYLEGIRHGEDDARLIIGERVRRAMREALR